MHNFDKRHHQHQQQPQHSFDFVKLPSFSGTNDTLLDENQLKVAFYNEEQDHSPSYLKFFLLIFAKDKAQAQEGQSPQKPKVHPMKGKAKY